MAPAGIVTPVLRFKSSRKKQIVNTRQRKTEHIGNEHRTASLAQKLALGVRTEERIVSTVVQGLGLYI